MKKSTLVVLCALFLSFGNLFSQNIADTTQVEEPLDSLQQAQIEKMKPRYGIYLHYALNVHSADFQGLPGVPSCCPIYDGGTATGLNLGALFELPLNDDFMLGARLGYADYSILMETNEPMQFIVDGKPAMGSYDHYLDSKIGTFGIEPYVSYKLADNFYASAGVRAALMTRKHYNTKQTLNPPNGTGTNLDGSIINNVSSGDIPNATSLLLGVQAGISYELALNKDSWLMLCPELMFKYNVNPLVSDLSWNVFSVHGGVAVKFKQPPPPPPPPPPPAAPPLPRMFDPVKPPVLLANVSAVEIDTNGRERKNFNIKIEDFVSLNMRPLLNYVFFEENSAAIPSRYHRIDAKDTSNFNLKKLQDMDALQTYYDVMNIVGKRMQQDPAAKITLVGCNANKDAEKGNKELSKNRAESVKNYLTSVWGVEDSRIIVQTRNLPKQETISDEAGADDENRRVEILSSNLKIVEPVITVDTMRVISKSTIRFLPKVKAEAGVKSWRLEAVKDGAKLVTYAGKDEIPGNIDWELSNEDSNVPRKAGSVEVMFVAEDSLGQRAESKKYRVPVAQLTIDRKRLERISDKEFEYYSLILFDYGRTNLASAHRKVVDFVKERLTDDATVYIKGYTDRMGEEPINERISTKRAQAVAKRLKIPAAQVIGLGESELLYDNSLPEGRFYCRTVTITIETPITDKTE